MSASASQYDARVDFYRDVLLELMTALGAALFVANVFALFRRRSDRRLESPVRGQARTASTGDLAAAPVGRTAGYALLGLIVFIWGLATITS